MSSKSKKAINQIRANDLIIKQLCSDKRYKIYPCGKIETLVQRTGQLSKTRTFRIQTPWVARGGYHRIKYCYKDLQLHRIVYQKYVGDLDAELTINHKDGNKQNNHFSNLEQISVIENVHHYLNVLKPAKKEACHV